MVAADTLAQSPVKADPRLIVALDVPTVTEARAMVEALGDAVSFYKVGLELFASDGMTLARDLKAAGKQVFLDWKLHDIGTTVQRSAAVLAVTVLTSLSDEDLVDMGYQETARALVERRIHQAIDAGCDGVISSPHEAALARALGGKDFLVVTPGVRPDWSARNDQARAATPLEALRAGASHIVCGRPVTAANDPEAAARRIAGEMSGLPA